jgi:hypothetical protein
MHRIRIRDPSNLQPPTPRLPAVHASVRPDSRKSRKSRRPRSPPLPSCTAPRVSVTGSLICYPIPRDALPASSPHQFFIKISNRLRSLASPLYMPVCVPTPKIPTPEMPSPPVLRPESQSPAHSPVSGVPDVSGVSYYVAPCNVYPDVQLCACMIMICLNLSV